VNAFCKSKAENEKNWEVFGKDLALYQECFSAWNGERLLTRCNALHQTSLYQRYDLIKSVVFLLLEGYRLLLAFISE
jgi:hypothetical protein